MEVNVVINNVEQRQITVACFIVDIDNVRQQRYYFRRRVLQRWITSKQRYECDHK